VKMRFAFLYLKRNFHDWIQRPDFLTLEVTSSIKTQTINSHGEMLAFRKQLWTTAILIGLRRRQ